MSTDIATQKPGNALAAMRDELPAHLQEELPDESVGEDALLPRVMIVQGTSDPKFKSTFGVGDVIISDTMTLLAKMGQPILLTPVFIYKQYEIRNPREATDLNAVRAATLDPKSEIAKKAFNRVEEPCPNNDGGIDKTTGEPRKMRYQTNLNSVWYLPEFEQLVALSFYRMEYQSGQRLSTLVQQRKKKMYSCIFQARTANRAYRGNNWYGFDFSNPTGISPWVMDADLHAQLKTMAEEQRDKYMQIIEATAHDVPENGTDAVDSPEAKQFT